MAEEKDKDKKEEVAKAASSATAKAAEGIRREPGAANAGMGDSKEEASQSAENQDKALGSDPILEPKNKDTPAAVIVSGGGGGAVISNAPLIMGIPVVSPLTDGLRALGFKEDNLVAGVAVAAPTVEGIPEMHTAAQAINNFDTPAKTGTITGYHDSVLQDGSVSFDFIDKDGEKRSKKHNADAGMMRELSNELEKTDGSTEKTQAVLKKFFGDNKRFNKDTLAE